jgi:arsenate reductase
MNGREMILVRKKVLFICKENACRSQMAEAIINSRLGDRYLAFSAGTSPANLVHPFTKQVLSEIGIAHKGVAKPLSIFLKDDFDMVITVCDEATEDCPVWWGSGKVIHMRLPDPVKYDGTTLEMIDRFRNVRDEIELKFVRFFQEMGEEKVNFDELQNL